MTKYPFIWIQTGRRRKKRKRKKEKLYKRRKIRYSPNLSFKLPHHPRAITITITTTQIRRLHYWLEMKAKTKRERKMKEKYLIRFEIIQRYIDK